MATSAPDVPPQFHPKLIAKKKKPTALVKQSSRSSLSITKHTGAISRPTYVHVLQVLSSPDSEAASREAAAAPEAGSGTPGESPIEVASVSTCGRQASSWLRIRPDIVLFGINKYISISPSCLRWPDPFK